MYSPQVMSVGSPTKISTPVTSSRQWATAIAPQGDFWDFIVQSYSLGDSRPAEWVVVKDFTTSPTQAITETVTGIFSHQFLTTTNILRAANGRIFFPAYQLYVFYYDPTDRAIHTISPIAETPPENPNTSYQWYTHQFGPDGRIYMGTDETNRNPMIAVLDTDTLAVTTLGYVGDSDVTAATRYAYYIQADTAIAGKRWVYVAVGKNAWELWAVSIDNGTTVKLAEVTATGNIAFFTRPEGIVVTIDTDLGQPDNVRTEYWCIDGAITHPYSFPYDPNSLPFTARNVTPYSNPAPNPPQIDDSAGIGLFKWRFGSNPWTNVNYTVNYSTPQTIQTITAIGDGTILGNTVQYQGWWRYDPNNPSAGTSWYGPMQDIEEAKVLALDTNKVYIAGYPNSGLFLYDPSQPWTSVDVTGTNPVNVGFFHTTSLSKHPASLLLGADGSLLHTGLLEREGIGTAVGRYDPRTKTFTGHHNYPLNFYNPIGAVAFQDPMWLVTSGSLHDDPAYPGQTPASAQLLVYDYSLKPVAQWTVKQGLTNTGAIYRHPTQRGYVVGVTSSALYTFDVIRGELRSWVNTAATGYSGTAPDGTIWVVVGGVLCRVDPDTLQLTRLLAYTGGFVPGCLAWHDTTLYLANNTDFNQQSVTKQTIPAPQVGALPTFKIQDFLKLLEII